MISDICDSDVHSTITHRTIVLINKDNTADIKNQLHHPVFQDSATNRANKSTKSRQQEQGESSHVIPVHESRDKHSSHRVKYSGIQAILEQRYNFET